VFLLPGRRTVLAVLIGGLVSSALVACGTQDDQPPSAEPKSSDRAPAQQDRPVSVDRRQLRAFPVLRRPVRPLPDAVSKRLGQAERRLFPSLARQLPTAFGYRSWAVPGDDYLCLVVATPKTDKYRTVDTLCDNTRKVLARHGISTTYLRPPPFPGAVQTRTTIGFADNHARTALIHTGRARRNVPVTNGFYATRDHASRPASAISIR
jgi:hypothetical protein